MFFLSDIKKNDKLKLIGAYICGYILRRAGQQALLLLFVRKGVTT